MMESTQRRAEQAAMPLKSAVGDVRRMKSAGSASVQELRAFLQSHRGKSSQELLGEFGKSNLFLAMINATVASLALLAVFTFVPYALYGKPEEKTAKRSAVQEAAPTNAAATTATAPGAAATTDASGVPDGIDVEKAKQVMGLDETKTAPGNVNPREKDLDNLLDGVK